MSVQSGWSRFTWGQANWNEATTLKTGWGAKSWGDGEWGELKNETITLTGLSSTTSVGALEIELKVNDKSILTAFTSSVE